MRICFFGDSFVAGVGDDACLGWPGRLCAAARHAGHDVTPYNLGIRRETSADIAMRWRAEARPRLPDGMDGRLIFAFGANDCTRGEGDEPRVAPDRTLVHLETILARAVRWRPTLMIGPLPVSDDPVIDERIRSLSEAFGPLCVRLEVPYLSVFENVAACAPWTREAAAGDGTHPNASGYAALAAIIEAWGPWRAWF